MDPTNSAFSDSFGPPHPDNPYLQRAISKTNAHCEGIWDNLERVATLEPAAAHAIVAEFLELACLAQHMGNIQIGRYGIGALPRAWVLANIEDVAEPMLATGGEWVYRRLLEVYQYLDLGLTRKLALRATADADGDIRECGRDFLDSASSPP